MEEYLEEGPVESTLLNGNENAFALIIFVGRSGCVIFCVIS